MPRLEMLAVAAGSGFAGFLTSFSLLQFHVQAMWLRYGLSVVAAYGVFLILIRAWMQYYRAHRAEILLLQCVRRPARDKSEVRWRDLLDLDDPLDVLLEFDEFALVILGVLLCIVIVYAAVSAAVLVPEWIAELVLDGVLTAALYHRIRQIDQRNWLHSAVRKTAGPFACLFVFFVLAGAACHAYAPEAASIGGVVHHAAAISRR